MEQGQKMQIEVDQNFEQFFEASKLLCLHTTKKKRRNYLVLWYGYPILGAVFASIAVFQLVTEKKMSGDLIFNIAASAFFLWCRFSARTRIRKVYEQQKRSFPLTMTLAPTGIHCVRKDGSANADYHWKAFDSWLERNEMFLLFPNSLTFLRIPKDKLTHANQDELRVWLLTSGLQRLDS